MSFNGSVYLLVADSRLDGRYLLKFGVTKKSIKNRVLNANHVFYKKSGIRKKFKVLKVFSTNAPYYLESGLKNMLYDCIKWKNYVEFPFKGEFFTAKNIWIIHFIFFWINQYMYHVERHYEGTSRDGKAIH